MNMQNIDFYIISWINNKSHQAYLTTSSSPSKNILARERIVQLHNGDLHNIQRLHFHDKFHKNSITLFGKNTGIIIIEFNIRNLL